MKVKTLLAVFLGSMILVSGAHAKAPATTIGNLKSAFTGETTASAKYSAFAKKAKSEGYANIALLFEAASKAESIHANNHKAALVQMGDTAPVVKPAVEVKSTKENLEAAIKGESYEVSTMYPKFIKEATAENAGMALMSFNYAYQTEQRHKAMYEKALKALNENRVSSLPSKYQVCTTCGNTYENAGPARCGLCMTPNERFVTIS